MALLHEALHYPSLNARPSHPTYRLATKANGRAMTYCLGWTTETCAYLVADTAVTSGRLPSTHLSSFGEAHISEATKNVEEGALKITSARGAGIAFSGNATLGRAVVDTFRMAVVAGLAPRPALQTAIASNVNSGDRVDLSVLCAFVEHGDPHLLSFNRDNDQCVVEHIPGDLVQLGSLVGSGNVVCQISDAFIGQLKKTDLEGSELLACALGLCQSYGIHNPLLPHGVGGAFVGAFVNVSGFHWQPNIGYLLFTPGEPDFSEHAGVFPFIRDDVLVVRSLLAGGPPRIFINSLGEPPETALIRATEVDQQCLAALRELQFDYLVFLNTAIPVVAVIEMGRRSDHREIIMHPLLPPSAEGKGQMPVSIGPTLYSLIGTTSDFVDARRPEPGAVLGAMLHYMNYQHPCFDIRHVGFDVEFFGDNEGNIQLPEHTISSYEAAKDTAPVFLQGRDNVGFGAAHLLKWYMDSQAKRMEDYIPQQERKPDGSTFTVVFPINVAVGSFYMNTVDGRRDIKVLKLIVEISWLPFDASRPRVGDLSGFSDYLLGSPIT